MMLDVQQSVPEYQLSLLDSLLATQDSCAIRSLFVSQVEE